METTAIFVDRKGWGSGPWDNEPDRLAFEHAGHPCVLKRQRLGHWCLYVGVPPGHPWHGKDYTDDDLDVDVHGGVTYGLRCDGDPVLGVCHVAPAGQPDDVWWIGADFAHGDDASPGIGIECADLEVREPLWGGTYKALSYVRNECELLAEQAAAASAVS